MKSKDSPNLYEILRVASNKSSGAGTPAAAEAKAPPSEGGQPSLQARLAAYKAAKLAMITQAASPPPEPVVATAEPPTPLSLPPPVVVASPPSAGAFEPPPAASAAEAEAETAKAAGPGERVIRVTYNTVAFAGLVAMGFLFISYSLGVRSGRASREAELSTSQDSDMPARKPPVAAEAEPVRPNPPPPPPAPPRVYSIRLVEWPARTAQERLKANDLAEQVRKALDRAGHPGAQPLSIRRGNEQRLAVYLGRYTDLSTAAVKSKLTAVRAVKVQNQFLLADAKFEETAP